jgi:hypothetical protein
MEEKIKWKPPAGRRRLEDSTREPHNYEYKNHCLKCKTNQRCSILRRFFGSLRNLTSSSTTSCYIPSPFSTSFVSLANALTAGAPSMTL